VIHVSVHPTQEDAARETATRVETAAAAAERVRGAAHVSLAGGTTPRRAYELLGPLLADPGGVDWWFGDERCVPPDDPDSNFRLVRESLLAAAPIPPERVHRIRGEDSPAAAARAYEEELRRVMPADATGIPVLDLALLGLGEDGHTASLFPGDPALDETEALVLPVVASKPPPNRVTLTLPMLRASREVVILATGAGKRDAVARILAGPDPATPASLLADATVTLVVDEAAHP
jgi:6-phosphogluconolactonase